MHTKKGYVSRCKACTWSHEADYVAAYHMSQAGLLPTEPNPIKKKMEDAQRLRKKVRELEISSMQDVVG